MASPRYRYQHQRLRAALLPYAVGQPCARCGKTILAGEKLDLDHDESGGYLGFSHVRCNRQAGARKGNAMRSKRAKPPPDRHSRDW